MTFQISPVVADALRHGRAVVALESTLICHGIPRPRNLDLAREIEATVRGAGAEPATIAVLGGRIKVGLTDDELTGLATTPVVVKCTTRDLPRLVAAGADGATTIAATIHLAHLAGIGVMATGGLGGVHAGGERSLDVSADLEELARTPVAVVCSGIKSILDQRRTMERLETHGVPVVGYRCAELPGFYTSESGIAVPSIDDLSALAALLDAHRQLGLGGGLVIAQPPPTADALPKATVDRLVADALDAANRAAIEGPDQTPFMLAHIAEHSGGRTVDLNCSLVVANARLAAQLAAARARPATGTERA